MDEQFLSFKQSTEVKELGFNESCFGYYVEGVLRGINLGYEELGGVKPYYQRFGFHTITNNDIDNSNKVIVTAPLKSQFFKWVREKHSLRGFIGWRPNVKKFDYHVYDMALSGIEYAKQRTLKEYNKDPLVGTYEQAEDGCIDKIIEILKNK